MAVKNNIVKSGFTSVDITDFQSAVSNNIDVSDNTQSINTFKTIDDFFNGSFIESVSFTVSSDGTTVSASIEQEGGGDLNIIFSDGIYTFDTTPAQSINLVAGSDTNPVINYIYILKSNKTLTTNTTGFPSSEYAPIATVICQSATSVQADEPYKVHVWVDHMKSTDHSGHLQHINKWIRYQHAMWLEGAATTYTTGDGQYDIAVDSGVVLQLHEHNYPAFDTALGSDLYVVNHSITPYLKVNNLVGLLTDSQGNSVSGKYFSHVFFGVVSEDLSQCKLFVNLSSGSYSKLQDAIDDNLRYANYTIPTKYKGTAFLISRAVVDHTVVNDNYTIAHSDSLLGFYPSLNAGSNTGSFVTEFSDGDFLLYNSGDISKEVSFDVSNISPSTNRIYSLPDASGTISLEGHTHTISEITDINDIPVEQHIVVFSKGVAVTTGDGAFSFSIGIKHDGKKLTQVYARHLVAGTSGTTSIQIHNVTTASDVLSTLLTIDANEIGSNTAATPVVINSSANSVSLYDNYRIDVDSVSTGAEGLQIIMYFTK